MKHRHLLQTCREGNYQHFGLFGCVYSTIVMLRRARYTREGVWPSLGFTSTVSLGRKLAGGGEVAPGGEVGPHTLEVCRAGSVRSKVSLWGPGECRCTTKTPHRHSDSISDFCYSSTAELSRLYPQQLLPPLLSVTPESTPDFISLSTHG